MTGRGVGVTDAIAGSVPDPLVGAVVVLTTLGSGYVVAGAPPVAAVLGARAGVLGRRDGARLLAMVGVGLAAIVLLKGVFAAPRPPASVAHVTAHGTGFPSGHAVGSAVLYGGLAALLDVGGRRQRYAAGAAMVVVVSATRLALGVHYLVDVVAGAGVGVAVVGGVLAVTRRRVGYGFGLAVMLAAGAVAVAGPTTDAVAALGGAAGGLVGWRIVAARGAVGRAVRPVAGAGAVVVAGGVAAASVGVGAGAIPVFGAHAAAGAVFVGLPATQNFSR